MCQECHIQDQSNESNNSTEPNSWEPASTKSPIDGDQSSDLPNCDIDTVNIPNDVQDLKPAGWSSKALKEILKFDPLKIQATVRQLHVSKQIIQDTPIEKLEGCYAKSQIRHECNIVPTVQRSLLPIEEGYEKDPEPIREPLNLPQLQYKISTVSCHKRQRGFQRKLRKRITQLTLDKET